MKTFEIPDGFQDATQYEYVSTHQQASFRLMSMEQALSPVQVQARMQEFRDSIEADFQLTQIQAPRLWTQSNEVLVCEMNDTADKSISRQSIRVYYAVKVFYEEQITTELTARFSPGNANNDAIVSAVLQSIRVRDSRRRLSLENGRENQDVLRIVGPVEVELPLDYLRLDDFTLQRDEDLLELSFAMPENKLTLLRSNDDSLYPSTIQVNNIRGDDLIEVKTFRVDLEDPRHTGNFDREEASRLTQGIRDSIR